MLNYDGFKSVERGIYDPNLNYDPYLSYNTSLTLCNCLIKYLGKIRIPILGDGHCIVSSSDFATCQLLDTSPVDHYVQSLNLLPDVPNPHWRHIENLLHDLVPTTRRQVVAFAREREINNKSFVCIPRGPREGDVGYIHFDEWAKHMEGESFHEHVFIC